MLRRPTWSAALAALALSLMGPIGSARAETVTVFGDDNYPPVSQLEQGRPRGLLPALLHEVGRRTGDEFVIRLFPWRRAYEQAQNGEGGIMGISFNQQRAQIFDYSEALYDDDIQIVVLKGRGFKFDSLESLRGMTIGGVLGASYGDRVDAAIKNGLFVVDRDVSQVGRMRKLLAGRLDAAFVGNGKIGIDYLLGGDATLRARRDDIEVLSPPLERDPLHLAFAKPMGKAALIQRFNAAVAAMRRSGELETILRANAGAATN
jgi:polar amino acid transport system substrate-binding protein